MQIFLKAIKICLPFIEVKDMAAKVKDMAANGEESGKPLPCILPFPVRVPAFNAKCVKNFGCCKQQLQTFCSTQK